MPITIGDTTITGLAAGGLPAGTITLPLNAAGYGPLIRAPQLINGGTSYTTPANCNRIYVECVGGGAGGGCGYTSASGGGGGGGYVAKMFSVSPNTSYSYVIGGGGGGNSSGGSTSGGSSGGGGGGGGGGASGESKGIRRRKP